MNYWLELSVVIFLLVLQSILCGFETAVIAVDRVKLHQLAEQGKRSRLIRHFLMKPARVLTTALIGINIAVIGSSTILTGVMLKINPIYGSLLATLILTPIDLILGEILPKIIFYQNPMKNSLFWAPFIRFLYYLIWPIVFIINHFSRLIFKLLRVPHDDDQLYISREDIKSIFFAYFQSDYRHGEHYPLIDKTLRIKELSVKQIMIPLRELHAFSEQSLADELIRNLEKNKYSNIPIYKNRIDHLIGYVNIFDLIQTAPTEPIQPIVRKTIIIPPKQPAIETLVEMSRRELPIAFITDEFGGIDGMVTLKDIWEFITGTIVDEVVEESFTLKEIRQDVFVLDGRQKIIDLEDNLGLELPQGDFETLNGFIINFLGRIPAIGEILRYGSFQITILEASDRYVHKVILKRINSEG